MEPEINCNSSLSSSSNVNGKVAMTVDRISDLPDCVTGIILSQLLVEESARTSILSTRWRRQWLLSPINIDEESLMGICANVTSSEEERSSWHVNTLTHILTLHPGPIRSYRLVDPSWNDHPQIITRLLQTLTQKGIQQLAIYMKGVFFDLPCCILECESLLHLHLVRATFPEHLSKRIFPNLRRLYMWSNNVRHHTLSDLLSPSSITDLNIAHCYGLDQVIVESNSLKRLTVLLTKKLVIKNAPNLECLILYGPHTGYRDLEILNAPKLKLLDRINLKISSLQLGESRFDRTFNHIKLGSFSTRIHSLTTLAIEVNFNFVNEGKSVPYLLSCFPCLETLDVQIDNRWNGMTDSSPSYGDYWEQHFDIDCLDHHLKDVQLVAYTGEQNQVDFANFIISKARVLKTMILVCGSKSDQWMETQKQRLLLGNRASQVAQVVFCETIVFRENFF